MMNEQFQLKLQALLDGELPERDARDVRRQLGQDADARALLEELTFTRDALAGNEPEQPVPETREFYWSHIERRIWQLKAEGSKVPVSGWVPSLLSWLRHGLVPVSGLALVLAASVASIALLNRNPASPSYYEVEMVAPEMGALSYRNEAERVTVVWVYNRSEPEAVKPVSDPWYDD